MKPDSQRLHFLDALRVIAFALLVVYHVGMYYVSWDWHVKSAHAGPALEPWMRLLSPWRMSLLFLLSGAATGCLMRAQAASSARSGGSAGAGVLAGLGSRLSRLLRPLLFGMAFVVPVQSWLEVVQKLHYGEGFATFLRLYASGYGGFCGAHGDCLVLPTWNHLWFLPYLALYTLLAWPLLRAWPQLHAALTQRAAALCARPLWLLALPVAWLAVTRAALLPRFPASHALWGDWALHAQYLPLFALGLLWSGQPQAWAALARRRHAAAAIALASWALGVAAPAGALPLPLRWLLGSAAQWGGVLAALGFARQHLNRPLPWVQRCGGAVFPLYLVHQSLLIVAARALAPLDLPPAVEAPLLLLAGFGGGWLFYRAVRRIDWLRPWCGLGPRAVAPSDQAAGAASRAEAASIEARRLA